MKKLILKSTPDLREYLEYEKDSNWSEDGENIVINYHDDEDLFNIGRLFGQFKNSVVRLQNYID